MKNNILNKFVYKKNHLVKYSLQISCGGSGREHSEVEEKIKPKTTVRRMPKDNPAPAE